MNVAFLQDLRRDQVALAGGKGANLGELVHAGFRVPPGFVLTTDAYRAFCAESGIGAEVVRLAREAGTDVERLRQAAAAIEALFHEGPLPPAIGEAVLTAYRRLGAEAKVAVRSSATAEDLPGASFAGQQETFLNVYGESELLHAVKACWASLWGERAMHYRAMRGYDHGAVSLAVVVQVMVDADCSGVIFSANPVTGEDGEVVVEAAAGLGEAVVSGAVTPGKFVIRKRDLKLLQTDPILPTEQAVALAKLAMKAERHFGAPQDMEFAIVAGKIYLLQSRPITTLSETHGLRGPRAKIFAKIKHEMASVLSERFPEPPLPFGWSLVGGVMSAALPGALHDLIGIAFPAGAVLFKEGPGACPVLAPSPPSPSLRMLGMPFRIRRGLASAGREYAAFRPAFEARVAALNASQMPPEAVLREAVDVYATAARRHFHNALLIGMAGTVLDKLLGDLAPRLAVAGPNLTLELNRKLTELAALAGRLPAVRQALLDGAPLETVLAEPVFADAWHEFMARYGHRECRVMDPSLPAWQDEPDVVLALLAGLVRRDAPAPAPSDLSEAREAARRRLGLRWPLARWLLERHSICLGLRENYHFHLSSTHPAMRRAGLAIGAHLAEAGRLERPEDVFFLKLEEATAPGAADLRPLVQERQAARARGLRMFPVVAAKPAAADGDALKGTPGSAGSASGPVRVIRDPSQFGEFRPGDVLVAPSTNPAWTPLFALAAAIIVETGGVLSHGAVVAREYGIPAVMGIPGATEVLKNGQTVHVDGARGLITPEGYRSEDQTPGS
ncbi:MAG TPA: PEP/pyruvate-binding domain-containing protein [Symbiobacteriaceae bacterium]|nr:PEP/pyruvate-binding domain-containing protein [Symbiobacteriaceae bacterium]